MFYIFLSETECSHPYATKAATPKRHKPGDIYKELYVAKFMLQKYTKTNCQIHKPSAGLRDILLCDASTSSINTYRFLQSLYL